jgi:hypothetical protein
MIEIKKGITNCDTFFFVLMVIYLYITYINKQTMKNLILIFILLFATLGISQSPNDTIYIDSVNIEYLEYLILEEINQLRMDSGYYKVQAKISEKESKKCRAWSNKLIMEGSFYHNTHCNTMEAIAGTILRTQPTITYGEFSKEIALQWYNSLKHRKIILHRSLYSGVGVAIGDTFKGNTTIKDNDYKRVVVTYRPSLD